MNWLKDILGSITKFIVNERVNDYRTSFLRYQDMMTQVTLETDKALMTFSIAALAALAALNDKIFGPYGTLSYLTFVAFSGVVVSVIVGYFVSKALIKDAQEIVSRNFKASLTTSLGRGMDKVKFHKLSSFLNLCSAVLFVGGIILFMILMAFYIKGVGK